MNNIKDLTKNDTSWYFFKINGLQIENQENWREFIFNDATIVNGFQLMEYIESLELQKEAVIPYYQPKDEKYNFIVVELTGKINSDNEKEFEKMRIEELTKLWDLSILCFYIYQIIKLGFALILKSMKLKRQMFFF